MGKITHWLILPLLLLLLVTTAAEEAAISMSNTEKDISTPLLTVQQQPAVLNTTTTIPDSPATNTTTSSSSPMFGSSSWCIASSSTNWMALQVALNYACDWVNCSQIQAGGSCYFPNTVEDHASYAFNAYYQMNPVPNSCNFRGAAMITSTNPSKGTCQFPSTSTSSSILDTSNQNISTIFGAVPGPSTTSSAAAGRLLKGFSHTTTTTLYVYALGFLLLPHRLSCDPN